MRKRVTIFCLIFSALMGASQSSAQDNPIDSPHGDWDTTIACSDCHSSNAWTPMDPQAAFDHENDAAFALLAAHETAACASCHSGLEFEPESAIIRECADCHEDVHNSKLVPTCETCHNERSFRDIDGFAIHLDTSFPLIGSHEVIACESCHDDDLGGWYFGDQPTCITCHESAYLETTVIPHEENGFSQECEDCHTQHVWPDAIFPEHSLLSDGFELIGAHEFAGCESCHIQPSFELVFAALDQNDCYACHQADYEDEHRNSGFPLNCLECHNQNDWDGASDFDHDAPFFPIYSGEHKGEWDNCSDCHQAAPDMTSFTCIDCHEHRKDKMDDEHDDEPDYVYESLACLSCHPDGKEDDDDD